MLPSRRLLAVLGFVMLTAGLWFSRASDEGRQPVRPEAPAPSVDLAVPDASLEAADSGPTASEERREIESSEEALDETAADDEPEVEAVVTAPTVVGRVLDPNGVPVADADVIEWSERSGETSIATSAEDGTFTAAIPERFARTLVARHPDWVRSERVTLATGPEPKPPVLRLRRGGRIEGQVIDSNGRPLGALVSVKYDVSTSRHERKPMNVETDVQGRFAFDGVLPVNTLVIAMPTDLPAAEGIPQEARLAVQSVRVADQGVHEVQIVCAREEPVLVHGRVIGADGPRADVDVYFFRFDAWVVSARTRSRSDGTYEVTLPQSGDYAVVVDRPDAGHTVSVDGAVGASATVRIPAETNSFTYDIRLPSGVVLGRLTHADDSPIRGRPYLLLQPEEVRVVPGRTLTTELNGLDFRFDDVPAGRYRLVASVSDIQHEYGSFGPFDVTADGPTDLGALRLRPLALTRIAVRDEVGNDVHRATIAVFDPTGRPHTAWPIGAYSASNDYRAYGPPGETSYVAAWTDDGLASPCVAFEPYSDREVVVELVVEPAARLVVLPMEDGRAVPAGVHVYNDADVRLSQLLWFESFRHTLHEPGVFFDPIAPGTYRVVVRGLSGAEAERTVTIYPEDDEVRLEVSLD